ncbi:hypothetical protein HDU99_004389 [Rhizoclosmatium hyalinum]|nr:hypothetical protein HDU99_004389 [Rhizoclosmatium hyalinum]
MTAVGSKKQQLLNTVATISKTLDSEQAHFPQLPDLPAKPNTTSPAKPVLGAISPTHNNTSSIFAGSNVFDGKSAIKKPQPQYSADREQFYQQTSASAQQMRESLKTLEEQNRKLHFEKAALVSTLIDIKPPPMPSQVYFTEQIQKQQPQPQAQKQQSNLQSSPLKSSLQHFGNENSAFQPVVVEDPTVRRQSLEIESLSSQCSILAAENKRLRTRAMELESLLLVATEETEKAPKIEKMNVDECVGTRDDRPPSPSQQETLLNALKSDFSHIIKRKQDLVRTLDAHNRTKDNIPTSLPLSEVFHLLDIFSDAFISTVTNRPPPATNTDRRPSLTNAPTPETTSALITLDTTILHFSTHPPTPPPPPQIPPETLKTLSDLSSLYITQLDAYTAFKTSTQSTLTHLHDQLTHLAHESASAHNDLTSTRAQLLDTQSRLDAKLAEAPAVIVDPDTVAIDFEKTVAPMKERVRVLEFECNRLRGVEQTLEGVIGEWKSENGTLRRMVDELSRGGGGGGVGGEEVRVLKEEVEALKGVLEDERLQYAKAREVIRVLRGPKSGEEMEGGDDSLDVEGLSIESGLRAGDRSVLSSHVKALHESVTRSLVDFDELVKVLGENGELKAKVSESAIRLEEQEKRLQRALNDTLHLEQTLSTTIKTHTETHTTLQTAHDALLQKNSTLTQETTRLQSEITHLHTITANYASQFSRIEMIASEWFDVKAEHYLQVEQHLLQQLEGVKRPHRLINFEGMFSRVLGILKDARERLKQSDERVRALTADVTEYTKSEKLAHEKVGHLEKSVESLKAKRDAQATRLAELEREFEEEVCLRKAVETKLRRVVKGSMALLEIPVDAALLGQITNFGTVVGGVGGSKSRSSSPHKNNAGRSSPSRDFGKDF